MSALAGIYSPNTAPDRSIVSKLSQTLQQRGPDGETIRATEQVAMLYRPFHIDRESRFTPQPVEAPDGVLLSIDGRLDNRHELRDALRDDLPDRPRTPDFFWAAYRKWGIDAFAHLIGDFAVALWDPSRDRLVLATDSLGLRPLYYYPQEGRVFWSSSARSLVEVLDLGLELDEAYIADFLTEPNPCERTPFRQVRAVPGGHALTVTGGDLQLHRIWQLDPGHEIRYPDDAEYEAHFREVFFQAVTSRLQTDSPVFAELSGGLDSSSIVCVADRVLGEGLATAPELHTVSYVYDTSPAADERPYMRLVEAQRGRQGIHVRDEDYPILMPLPPGFKTDLPSNQISFLGRRTALMETMREKGSRVVLRGEVGDQVFWGDIGYVPFDLADHLRQGKLWTLARECRNWSRVLRSTFPNVLWQGAIWPNLPRRLQAKTFYLEPEVEWLNPDLVRRMDFEIRMLGPQDDVGFRLPSNRRQYSLIKAGTRLHALQMYVPDGHIEGSYPFLDRRVVEFAMAIPVDQKIRLGETRSILRRSLKGILPEKVRTRRTKGGPTQAFQRALVREWPWLRRLLSEPRVCDFGIVEREPFVQAMHKARHGVLSHPSMLLRTISLELWLRSFESRSETDSGAHRLGTASEGNAWSTKPASLTAAL